MILKYSLSSVVLSIVVTLIVVAIIKDFGVYVGFGVGGFTAWVACRWFARSEKRKLKAKEHLWITTIYWACIFALLLVPAILNPNTTGAGIIILVMNSMAYAGMFAIIFSNKYLSVYLEKERNKQ